jgi:hypothetical protein
MILKNDLTTKIKPTNDEKRNPKCHNIIDSGNRIYNFLQNQHPRILFINP